MGLTAAERDAYLRTCRSDAIRFIESLIPEQYRGHPAYASVLNYPLRGAKGLRPALAVAACRALGGNLSEILPTASVLELLHNAFLVHDDVEDGSDLRRHAPTLAVQLGIPRAVHTGDTMLALSLGPLLDNMRLLDLGRAIRILDLIHVVMRRTVEGQGLELSWIAENRWDISPGAYVEMVTLKTAWYTFAAPLLGGAIAAEAPGALIESLREFALCLGVAFQIRDDALNLVADETVTGKERWGDLWEGKRTLILSLFFNGASASDAAFARTVLRKQRQPTTRDVGSDARLARALELLASSTNLDAHVLAQVGDAFRAAGADVFKSMDEVERLRSMLSTSIEQATRMGLDFAERASRLWDALRNEMGPSIHRDVIESVLEYTMARDH
jgi:geranylgeranyl diphosphate synthase type II